MATPRKISSYEIEYIRLFETAGRERYVIECESVEAARRLRRYLYAVRQALILDPEEYPLCALLAPLVTFKIEGTNLIAEPEQTHADRISGDLLNDNRTSHPDDRDPPTKLPA